MARLLASCIRSLLDCTLELSLSISAFCELISLFMSSAMCFRLFTHDETLTQFNPLLPTAPLVARLLLWTSILRVLHKIEIIGQSSKTGHRFYITSYLCNVSDFRQASLISKNQRHTYKL